jgi:hypothetical protein
VTAHLTTFFLLSYTLLQQQQQLLLLLSLLEKKKKKSTVVTQKNRHTDASLFEKRRTLSRVSAPCVPPFFPLFFYSVFSFVICSVFFFVEYTSTYNLWIDH